MHEMAIAVGGFGVCKTTRNLSTVAPRANEPLEIRPKLHSNSGGWCYRMHFLGSSISDSVERNIILDRTKRWGVYLYFSFNLRCLAYSSTRARRLGPRWG
jgi:hypothetical protein